MICYLSPIYFDNVKKVIEFIYKHMQLKICKCILTVFVVQRLVGFMVVEVWEAPF